jgi:hypothetical protein
MLIAEGQSAMRLSLFSLLAVVGVMALVVAGLTVWLVVQDPVVVADAVATGELQPLLSTLAHELEGWMAALVRLL